MLSMKPEAKPPRSSSDDWNECYVSGFLPWDSGIVDRDLQRTLEAKDWTPRTVLELGCGSGTNAIYLARRGFTVTAVDFAPTAIEQAVAKARAAGVSVQFLCADVTKLDDLREPFDFVFDRGCYHSLRRAGQLSGYLKTVERLTQTGSRLLVLAGNPDANEAGGPPRVRAAELCSDFEKTFALQHLTAMRFEDAGHVEGPLGWSALFVRR